MRLLPEIGFKHAKGNYEKKLAWKDLHVTATTNQVYISVYIGIKKLYGDFVVTFLLKSKVGEICSYKVIKSMCTRLVTILL